MSEDLARSSRVELTPYRGFVSLGDKGDSTPAAAPNVSLAPSHGVHGRHPGDLLLHPFALGALAVLVFNDHVAKERWPSAITGKASDVAGLAFFPLLLVAFAEAARRAARRNPWTLDRRALALAIGTTAVVFAAIKVWAPASEAFEVANGYARWPLDALPALFRGQSVPQVGHVHVVMDATDLVALVALTIPWGVGRRVFRVREPEPR